MNIFITQDSCPHNSLLGRFYRWSAIWRGRRWLGHGFFFSSIAVFTIRSNSCCLLISSPTSTHLPFFYWHTIKTAHLPCTWSIIFFIRTQKLASRGLSLSSARLIYPVAYTTPELHLHGRYLKWTNNLESQSQMWHLTAYTRKYSEPQNVDTLKFTIMGLCGRSSCPILCRRKY